MRQIFEDAGSLHYDSAVNKWFLQDEISDKAIRDFKSQAGITSTSPNWELIKNLEILGPKGEMTNAVPMFFSDECGKRIPQAVIRCVQFKGKDRYHIIDSQTFEGPLLRQYNETTIWIQQKLAVEFVMDGFNPRKEIWDIPLDAVKEAITNAICHRDYYDTGAVIMVEIYNDRLTITNPGGLLPDVAKDFGHLSKSRNPKIFSMFTRMHLVEKVGSGIPRMANLMAEAKLPSPEYKTEGFFSVTLYKRATASSDNVGENVGENKQEKLTPKAKRDKAILEQMRSNPKISAAELSELLDVSERTIDRDIARLSEAKKITRQGGDKGGDWVVL